MSSCHLLLGRPLDLFPLLGCHSMHRFVHLLSSSLAIWPAHFHFCFSVYSMISMIFVLFLISKHGILSFSFRSNFVGLLESKGETQYNLPLGGIVEGRKLACYLAPCRLTWVKRRNSPYDAPWRQTRFKRRKLVYLVPWRHSRFKKRKLAYLVPWRHARVKRRQLAYLAPWRHPRFKRMKLTYLAP